MDSQLTPITNQAVIVNMVILAALIAIFLIGLTAIAHYKIFKKAGQPSLAAFVPFYSQVILYRIAGLKNKQILLSYFLPRTQGQMLIQGLGKAFGKQYKDSFMFFGTFFVILELGFGSAKYIGNNNSVN